MKAAGLYFWIGLVAVSVRTEAMAGSKAAIAAADPRILLRGRVDNGQTLLVVEEAIPDTFRGSSGPPPDASGPIYRCSVIVISAGREQATVVWTSLGRIEGFDDRVRPFEARVFGDVIVLTYLKGHDVCAQVFRRSNDGSFTHMTDGSPIISREIAGGMKTVGAHVEGDIADGSLCISLDQRKDGKRGGPVCFRLATHGDRDEWVHADPATTRPATRPAIGREDVKT
jgi:hypothetical protein